MHGLGFTAAGLLVGVAVGATGVGGGSLMTPMLIVLFGIAPAVAVGTDLLYAAISKTFAVGLHGRYGSVDWSIVGWQALGSLPAALICLAWLHHYGGALASRPIERVLACAVIVTAAFLLFQEPLRQLLKQRAAADESPALLRRRLSTVVAGALIGAVVTVSSVGAGVIGLMLLLLIYPRVEPIRLVGSDLAHSVVITAIAGIGHAALGTVNYGLLGALLIGGLPGIWLGVHIGYRMSAVRLRHSLAGLLILVGFSALIKTLVG